MRLSGRVRPAAPVRVLVEFKGGDGQWRRVRVLRGRLRGTNFSAALRAAPARALPADGTDGGAGRACDGRAAAGAGRPLALRRLDDLEAAVVADEHAAVAGARSRAASGPLSSAAFARISASSAVGASAVDLHDARERGPAGRGVEQVVGGRGRARRASCGGRCRSSRRRRRRERERVQRRGRRTGSRRGRGARVAPRRRGAGRRRSRPRSAAWRASALGEDVGEQALGEAAAVERDAGRAADDVRPRGRTRSRASARSRLPAGRTAPRREPRARASAGAGARGRAVAGAPRSRAAASPSTSPPVALAGVGDRLDEAAHQRADGDRPRAGRR